MFSDIILELSTEKIRKDFGDLCATIFQIISFQNGCFISELNSIFPKIQYSIIRTSLYLLFQHNIIYFSENFNKNFYGDYRVKEIKIYSRIYEPIYRFRFLRYLSLAEQEYGMIGKLITQKFLEDGQIFPKRFLKKYNVNINIKQTKLEDIFIQMTRDGLLTLVLGHFSFLKIYSIIVHEKKISFKPLFKSKKFSWKISTSRFNLFIRANLVIGLINEYYGSKCLDIIRSCTCRIFGVESDFFFTGCFSIDTLVDDKDDIKKKNEINETVIIQLIEELSINNFFIKLIESSIKIVYYKFLEIIKSKTIENLIINQYGNDFFLVFSSFKKNSENSEREITKNCILNDFIIRKELYRMYRLGFIYIRDHEKAYDTYSNNKKTFFWKLNIEIIQKKFTSELLKCIFNILVKIEDIEQILIKKFFSKSLIKNTILSSNSFNNQIKAMLISLIRLDELLIIFGL